MASRTPVTAKVSAAMLSTETDGAAGRVSGRMATRPPAQMAQEFEACHAVVVPASDSPCVWTSGRRATRSSAAARTRSVFDEGDPPGIVCRIELQEEGNGGRYSPQSRRRGGADDIRRDRREYSAVTRWAHAALPGGWRMTRTARVSLFVLLLASTAGWGGALRIGTVEVVTEDVFTGEEARLRAVYRLTNVLHVTTRERLVRGLLLFSEGDVYDPEALAQTERNLRALGFLKSASVTASPPHDGVVDVVVVTQDSWSTEPALSFGSAGGSGTWEMDVTESNLFGMGRRVTALYDSNDDRTRRMIRLVDPSFLRPYWKADLLYSNNSDGMQRRLEVGRGFVSIDTPWAAEFIADDLEEDEKLYWNSYEFSRFARDHSRIFLIVGRTLPRNEGPAHRLSFGIDFVQDAFAPAGEAPVVPEDREFRYLLARYSLLQNAWIKRTFVNRDLHVEDFNLGLDLSATVGISPKGLGVEETTGLIGLSVARGAELGPDTFAVLRGAWRQRVRTDRRNAILEAESSLVRSWRTAHPQTSILHARLQRGSDLDADVQFFADGETGLRGYRLHAFEGSQALVANLEHRMFLGRELWHILSPGAALFVDTGTAGSDLSRLRTDLGVGLRLGITRAPRNLFRLDVAYAVDPDPRGERGWIVSFSSGQAF